MGDGSAGRRLPVGVREAVADALHVAVVSRAVRGGDGLPELYERQGGTGGVGGLDADGVEDVVLASVDGVRKGP